MGFEPTTLCEPCSEEKVSDRPIKQDLDTSEGLFATSTSDLLKWETPRMVQTVWLGLKQT